MQSDLPCGDIQVPRQAMWRMAILAMFLPASVQAFELNIADDHWKLNWDNTLTYNLGARVRDVNPLIGNNPAFHQAEHKFPNAGDVVTNRASVLTEFNAIYQGRMGVRLSASAWKDLAYDRDAATNPGTYAPGIPYSAIQAYPGGRYSSYTDRYYVQGAQLLDAFLFSNFEVAGKPTYLKLGQLTEYWGNAMFFPYQALSYSQGAIDGIKLASSPGTDVKELFIPRQQMSLTSQITPELALSAQYFLGFTRNRLPEGGTFRGPVDFLFQGPSSMFAGAVPDGTGSFFPFSIPAGGANVPPKRNNNFGVKLAWTPSSMNGAVSAQYRKFDEVQPWSPLFNFGPGGLPTDYHLAYNQGAELFGVSVDTTLGQVSTGLELSYRRNTALNSNGFNPAVPVQTEGAKGNTLNIVANALVPLSRTPLWDTGILAAELAVTHLRDVTSNEALYNGVGRAGCVGGKWDGCSTRNYVAFAFKIEPQWLQVFPGVDLSAPISDVIGVYGNSPSLEGGIYQGSHNFSVGLKALIRQKTSITLAYNGAYYRTNGVTTTPSGLPLYSGGNGGFGLNDRNWISLTAQTSF
ncbi:DUF1302 domain-containing protein [Noviherbaspirillum saxi]|uniref:DUF1302 family protein n=1 Tax=Noviherbaspirillum saxi TaxID=2320863 RepID=A0A3A3FZ27_9BURK|nr:DUF1302 family protein [Noviherbaspirillum saxi]RJF92349.1 DUF1302 family protein [Noviherbaspirillum saxi]